MYMSLSLRLVRRLCLMLVALPAQGELKDTFVCVASALIEHTDVCDVPGSLVYQGHYLALDSFLSNKYCGLGRYNPAVVVSYYRRRAR